MRAVNGDEQPHCCRFSWPESNILNIFVCVISFEDYLLLDTFRVNASSLFNVRQIDLLSQLDFANFAAPESCKRLYCCC